MCSQFIRILHPLGYLNKLHALLKTLLLLSLSCSKASLTGAVNQFSAWSTTVPWGCQRSYMLLSLYKSDFLTLIVLGDFRQLSLTAYFQHGSLQINKTTSRLRTVTITFLFLKAFLAGSEQVIFSWRLSIKKCWSVGEHGLEWLLLSTIFGYLATERVVKLLRSVPTGFLVLWTSCLFIFTFRICVVFLLLKNDIFVVFGSAKYGNFHHQERIYSTKIAWSGGLTLAINIVGNFLYKCVKWLQNCWVFRTWLFRLVH